MHTAWHGSMISKVGVVWLGKVLDEGFSGCASNCNHHDSIYFDG